MTPTKSKRIDNSVASPVAIEPAVLVVPVLKLKEADEESVEPPRVKNVADFSDVIARELSNAASGVSIHRVNQLKTNSTQADKRRSLRIGVARQ